MAKPAGTPFDPSVVAQASAGYQVSFSYSSTPYSWFGPGVPMAPVTPLGIEPRTFDYPTGLNMLSTPRRDSAAGVTFEQLRALADGYDLLRLVIETRKDQIEALDWVVRPRLAKGRTATPTELARADAAATFLNSPDRHHSWSQWIRMALEEMLVTDALTVFPRPTRGGGIYALDLLDGATIKPLIDETGRTPLPPAPAYQQALKGMPAVNFTRDELLYSVANPRVNKLYGYSPVEQILTTVNLALKRQLGQITYYTEGNIPEALMSVPESWTAAQLREYQTHWDSMMVDALATRRRLRFVPGGMRYQPTTEPVIKDQFDEWLARIVCFAFSISPTPFVAQVNRAVAESSLEQAAAEGLLPLMKRIKGVVDRCLVILGYADCAFFWEDDEDEKPLETAQVHATYVNAKILTRDEVRESLNRAPLPNGQGATIEEAKPAPAPFGQRDAVTPANDDAGDVERVDRPDWLKGVKTLKVPNTRPAVNRAASKLAKAVKAILSEKADRVATQAASRLSRITKAEEPPEDDRGRADEFVDGFTFGSWSDLQDIVREYVAEVAEDAGRQAVVALGARVSPDAREDLFSVVHDDAVAIAKERAAKLVTEISDSTRDMLRSTVADAIKGGWSAEELADKIRESTAFSPERAENIARTELGMANSEGCREAWKASGMVEGKQWLLGSDSCEICQGNADEGVIPFEQAFSSGHQGPLAHPQCTCDLAAVMAPEET